MPPLRLNSTRGGLAPTRLGLGHERDRIEQSQSSLPRAPYRERQEAGRSPRDSMPLGAQTEILVGRPAPTDIKGF